MIVGGVTELGILGVFAILVVRELLSLIKSLVERKNGRKKMWDYPVVGSVIGKQIQQLYEWHDPARRGSILAVLERVEQRCERCLARHGGVMDD